MSTEKLPYGYTKTMAMSFLDGEAIFDNQFQNGYQKEGEDKTIVYTLVATDYRDRPVATLVEVIPHHVIESALECGGQPLVDLSVEMVFSQLLHDAAKVMADSIESDALAAGMTKAQIVAAVKDGEAGRTLIVTTIARHQAIKNLDALGVDRTTVLKGLGLV